MRSKIFHQFELADLKIFPGYEDPPEAPVPLTQAQVEDIVKASVNNTVNAAIANLRKKDLPEMFTAQLAPINSTLSTISEAIKGIGAPPPNGGGTKKEGEGSSTGVPPEVNAQLRELGSTVKTQGDMIKGLTEERNAAIAKAEKTDRASNIRAALSGIDFANPSAAETAFMLIEPKVQKTEDGSYIAEDLPLSDFVKNFLPTSHAYLLKATGAGGSGAHNNGGTTRTTGKPADISMIQPGMSAETRASIMNAISNATRHS